MIASACRFPGDLSLGVDASKREAIETAVTERCRAGDADGAASELVRGYGPEILGFLVAQLGSEADASDVFSLFCEQVWKGLPSFSFQSSIRTWSYTVARHAAFHHRKASRRRAMREVGAGGSAIADVAEAVRTATLPWIRTSTKTRFAALRDDLPEEDRALLVLRVDKGMAWEDIARVLLVTAEGGDEAPSEAPPDAIRRESARLRKRFQLVKERLVQRARSEGLLRHDEEH